VQQQRDQGRPAPRGRQLGRLTNAHPEGRRAIRLQQHILAEDRRQQQDQVEEEQARLRVLEHRADRRALARARLDRARDRIALL
jgi:hypothetical protein